MPERIQFPLLFQVPVMGHFGQKELSASNRRGVVPAWSFLKALAQGQGIILIDVFFPRGLEEAGWETARSEKTVPECNKTQPALSFPPPGQGRSD